MGFRSLWTSISCGEPAKLKQALWPPRICSWPLPWSFAALQRVFEREGQLHQAPRAGGPESSEQRHKSALSLCRFQPFNRFGIRSPLSAPPLRFRSSAPAGRGCRFVGSVCRFVDRSSEAP